MQAAERISLCWNPWFLAPLVLAWAAVATPYSLTHNLLLLGFALHRGFALVCHQQPERCFWIFGAPVAVCARCLGIYLGAAAGLLIRTSRRIALQLLLAAAAINLIEWIAELGGLYGNWLNVRFCLGLALGAAGAMLVSSSIFEAEHPALPPDCTPSIEKSALPGDPAQNAGSTRLRPRGAAHLL